MSPFPPNDHRWYRLIRQCSPGPGGHQLLFIGHRCQAAPHSHLPHGGGKPVQGRVPARGDQPQDRGHYFGREHGVFRACPPVSGGLRPPEGADVCDRLSHGGGPA